MRRKEERIDDLEAVMLEEKARGRGRKPVDAELIQERRRVKRRMGSLLRIKDKQTFLRALKDDYGLQAGSERYRLALKEWLVYQQTYGA
ncbi:MAG: hypothetical protein MN733_34865 [Nitrososphaera sp.]|nr:hypothetical protein [Nitrososphaera sp.]